MSKEIVSGIAITSLIFAVALHMPIIGFFCALFIPLPVLFYRAKLGRNNGAFVPAGTIIIMLVVLGKPSVDVLVFSELMLIGFLLAEMFEINLSVEQTVLYACGIVLATAAGCLIFYSGVSNTGIGPLLTAYVAQNLELTLDLYRNIGVSEENIQVISDSMPQIQYVLVRIIPAFAVMSSLFVSWTTLLISRPILKSRNLTVPAFGPLNQWRAPDHLVWGAIGCGVTLLTSAKGLKMIGLNGLLILMTVYFFQGIAIVSYFFEKKNFPRSIRFFLYSLIALQQMALLVVIAFGFFDMWLNFRKLDLNKEK